MNIENLKRLICATALSVAALNLHAGYTAGETLWQTNFPSPQVFRVETRGNDKVTLRPGVKLSGVVLVEAVVKGTDVTRGPNGWNGPKVMFPYRKADGTADNPQLRGAYGTYDWQTWTRVMSFPEKGVDAAIVLGLEECTGEFQIRSVKIARADATADETMAPVPIDPTLPRGKFLGSRNPKALRGVMSGGDMGEAAVAELADWGVKLVRLQISGLKDAGSPEAYQQALAQKLVERKEIVDRLWTKGIRTVLDLHQGPGCAQTKILQNRLPADYDATDLCRAWVQIATVFKGHPGVWGYDILNEPICPEATWKRICRDVMAAVRKVDAETPFVMSIPDTRAFDYYVPNEKVIYSPHYYSPHALTHQGIINEGMLRWSYPGVIEGERWDRETIRQHLRPVIEFQLRHPDARIYVGEFSCIPWVKGDAEYVRDCISVFEEYGWDWTYHAYREWPGWDVDYDAVKDYEKKLYKPTQPSPRKRVLLEALGKGNSALMVQVPGYGTDVSVAGGSLGIALYRPGWEGGVPKEAYEVTTSWTQDGADVCGTYRVRFKRDLDLECVGLSWKVGATQTAGREWTADGVGGEIPERFVRIGLGGGTAGRFVFPVPENCSLTVSFAEPIRYTLQDGRRWGDNWFVRFGPALGRRVHRAGEELVYAFRFSSDEGVTLEKGERCVIRPGAQWAPLENRKDIEPGSALDFSGMGLQDAPAGKYGWLRAVGGAFEFADRPGVPQRFYGINLCFTANYPDRADADRLIARFVRLGYNTIRVHHHDEMWTRHPEERDRLDYLIARAIASGLYVTTDLYVSRHVTWRELGEDRDGQVNMQLYKTLVALDDAAYADWQKHARAFLEHVNPHTGRAYKDEPGLPFLSLVNEGNLGMGFGRSGKATDPKVLAAWRAFSGKADAKAVPDPWANDEARRFDADIERRFAEKATRFLREIGVKALLTNDNNGSSHGEGEGATPLYDYVDNHFYIDHPEFLETPWKLPSKCPNANPIRLKQPKLFAKGYAKNASKPYAISEWNFSGPGRYRGLGGLLTGALAARDDWDALWRFTYSHDRRNLNDGANQAPYYFDCTTDPLSQASDRASVCLFLRGDAKDGAVTTDAANGTMSFVSARTCGGFVETGRLEAGALTAEVSGAPAAIWVSSLDGKSVNESARLLLAHVTDVQGNGTVYADSSRRILLAWGRGCLVEKGRATVRLEHPDDLQVWALDTTGRRRAPVAVRREGTALVFDCTADQGSLYYELARDLRLRPRARGIHRSERHGAHVQRQDESPLSSSLRLSDGLLAACVSR